MPIILGKTAAKKFGASETVGMAIGAALVYPKMVASTAGDVLGTVLTYLVIGPIAAVLTSIVLMIFNAVTALPVVGGVLAGVLVGGTWQVLVIFGLHWALTSVGIANIAQFGFDTVLVGKVGCEMA